MKHHPQPVATPWQESSGICACCGGTSRTIWGDLSTEEARLAAYFVQWTVGSPGHDVNIDLVIGAWGEGTDPKARVLASVLFRPSSSGGSFMVIDGENRFAAKSRLCGRAMQRVDIVGTPFAQEVFSLLDGIWMSDPRIADIKALNELA